MPARELVFWIFAFILWGVLRQKFASMPADDIGLGIFQHVTALELLEVYFIARLALALRPSDIVGPGVALATLGVVAALVLLLRYRPTYASGGLELWLLALSVFVSSIRVVAWAITLFVFQFIVQSGPFLWLHELIGRVDAEVLRGLLAEAGHQTTGVGPLVYVVGNDFAIDVMGACSSSHVIATVIAGYLIIVLGRRGRLVPGDVSWITGLLVVGIMINWMRLLPTALSREGHAYWHDGDGAGLVSLAYGAMTIGAAFAATRGASRAT
ncbi:hypothetical protein [Alsobacter sp. R-9]